MSSLPHVETMHKTYNNVYHSAYAHALQEGETNERPSFAPHEPPTSIAHANECRKSVGMDFETSGVRIVPAMIDHS